MRTSDRLSPAVALARLSVQADRLRQLVRGQRPAVRWGLALAALLGVGAAVYWTATSLTPIGIRYLASGRRFSSEDLIKVCRAFDEQRIEYRVDDQRRVEVGADQFDPAAELYAKLDVGQHAIDEILKESNTESVFDPPGRRDQRKLLARQKILERLIGELDGVAWSLVSINRPRASVWQHPTPQPSAFVYIETDGNRRLPSQTVQAIPAILAGYEPGLAPGSITVMDHRGNRYLDPGNPAIWDISRSRAREEEISAEIRERLDWIKGVRIQVRVISPRTMLPATTPAGASPGVGTASRSNPAVDRAALARAGSGLPKPRLGGTSPAMAVNHPVELDAEAEPAPTPPPPASAGSAAANSAAPAIGGHLGDHAHERGRVLIYVPRSFYYGAEIKAENRAPSRDDLRAMADRTENQIRTALRFVLPETGSWEVTVDTIPDEVPLYRPVVLASPADPRRKALDWGIVGAAVAAVSVLVAMGSWIQAARRPARQPEPAQPGGRYHAGSASEPGPSERVRELVRRNPEAAASVLERWAGQGGRLS
jgi:hypothetical protein